MQLMYKILPIHVIQTTHIVEKQILMKNIMYHVAFICQ